MSAWMKRLVLGLAAAALVAAAPALAQDGFIASPGGAVAAGAPAQPSSPYAGGSGEGPDESALRYYAQQKQTGRVNTEIKRLQRLYPTWRVPTDLWDVSAPGGEDEDDLWALFSADRIDELRAAIEDREKAEPDWRPSQDLMTKLARKEGRLRIMELWRSGDMDRLVALVKSNPQALEDADIEATWVVAEALAKAKQTTDALAIYESILRSSKKSDERIATIQKAMGVLRMMDVERLIAMGAKPGGGNEFDVILIDITRARIAAYLHDERAEEIPQSDWEAFQAYARGDDDANQAGLCAWYLYKRQQYRDALEFFKISLEKGGDAMIAHGLAHSLRQLGMKRETEEVAYAWRQPLINNSILFIDILETDLTKEVPPFIEPERLLRYGQVTMETASGEGAQALAWYAYNSCQYDVALQWFQRAVAWHPKDSTVYGYALTLRKLKRSKEFIEVTNRYDGLFPQLIGLIFPDNIYRPPTPCDIQAGARPAMALAVGQGQYLGQQYPGQQFLGQQMAQGQRPQVASAPQGMVNDPSRQYAWGRVPVPGAGYAPGAASMSLAPGEQMPKLNPKEFPIPVNPQNDLRFAPTPQPGAEPPQASPAAFGGFAREPYPGPWPMVARRVPGVGPMPYERFGFSLLPGWNGTTTATWPPASAQIAPAGTAWAQEAVAESSTPQRAAGGR